MLIFDEVVTGFRHHLGGYQAICGIRPDLTTFAKAMANGYPIAALGGRADIMDRFNTRVGGDVMFGGTYNGHAVATAAALATLDLLEADDRAVHRRHLRAGRAMRRGLEEITERLGITARPTSFGSVWVLLLHGSDRAQLRRRPHQRRRPVRRLPSGPDRSRLPDGADQPQAQPHHRGAH